MSSQKWAKDHSLVVVETVNWIVGFYLININVNEIR